MVATSLPFIDSGRIVGVTESVAPASDPLTFAEAQAHLRLDSDDEQVLVEGLISAATALVEAETGRSLITRTLIQSWHGWPARFLLRGGPVSSVASVEYQATVGVWTELDSGLYRPDLDATPARLWWDLAASPPTVAEIPASVRATYSAGYADADSVPRTLRQALLLLIDHWFENRGAGTLGQVVTMIPAGLASVMAPHVINVEM